MFADFILTSGLTRSQWADRLQISRSYLSDLLNGNKRPSLELAVAIERETSGCVPATSWVPVPPVTPVPAPTPTPEEDAA